jgi:hypothetical protein
VKQKRTKRQNKNIKMNNINDILNSIEGLQPASPKPFLTTRVQAAIANKKNNNVYIQWLTKPTIAFSIIVLITFANVLTINQNNDDENDTDDTITNNDYTALEDNIWTETNFNK